MNQNDRSAFIAIVGKPNVGKSSILNRILGEKIAIVTNKPQTTRTRIMGVLTEGDCQLVFTDTPGMHKARTSLGKYMVKSVTETVSGADACLLVVDATEEISDTERDLIDRMKAMDLPCVLAINKIDTVEKEALLEVIAVYSQAAKFEAIIPISAKTGDGVEELLDFCKKYAVESPFLFPEDVTTDQPERQVMAEIIREKLLWCLEREVPHGTAVEITKFSERENEVIDIDATIYCEKASHKGIIIGKRGEMLKKISSLARADCEKFMGTRVYLTTWVKVKENWRDSDFLVRNFGYSE